MKVLRPELAAALGPERYLQEIEIAAQLHHPHILPLYDSGDADGFLYYVMPYEEGQSLREKLAKERELPIAEAVRILRDVVDALSHAHKHNVVHRDIKPDNVMLSDRHALVTDFGVAKAVNEATGRQQLTTEGVALGTPTYMAPEQAAADPHIDHRADIYAVGAVAYELLTGRPPFLGTTPQMILSAHITDSPEPVTKYREAVPPALEQLVLKCLEKKAADRWQTAEELLPQLEALATPSGGVTPTGTMPVDGVRKRRRMMVGAAGAVVAIVVAVFVVWMSGGEPEGPPRLAVLPFENLGSPDDEAFADGLTDEIQSRLSSLSGLFVTSFTSAIEYKGHSKTRTEIGAELSVDYLLEGTMRKDRVPDGIDQVRITPRLIRISDGAHLWSEPSTAEHAAGEFFRVQAEIAEEVARALDVTLLEPERQRLAEQPTTSLEAWNHYQRGNQFWSRSTNRADNRLAAEQYEKAVAEDSMFALAYAALARAWGAVSINKADDDPWTRGMEALDHAIRLQPNLPEVRLVQAGQHYAHGRYDQAIEIQREVLRNRPNHIQALASLGGAERRLGMWDEALETQTRSMALDPRNPGGVLLLAQTHGRMRNYAEAEHYYGLYADLAPEVPSRGRAWLRLVREGDVSGAERLWRQDVQRLGLAQVLRDQAFSEMHFMWFGLPNWAFCQDLKEFTVTTLGADPADYYLARAVSEHTEGDTVRAQAYYDSVRAVLEPIVQMQPDIAWAHSQLGIVYAGLGRHDDAVREALRGVELRPLSGDAFAGTQSLMYLARTYILVGEYDEAIEILDTLVNIPSLYSRALLRVHTLFDPLRDRPRFQALFEERN